jgi:hypothetical protein
MTFSLPPRRGLLLLGCLAAAPMGALAQEPSRLMRPGQLDVHAEGGLSLRVSWSTGTGSPAEG